MQIYRAKAKELEDIEGTHIASYNKLHKYAELLRQHNANSICKVYKKYTMPDFLDSLSALKHKKWVS